MSQSSTTPATTTLSSSGKVARIYPWQMNRRQKTVLTIGLCLGFFALALLGGRIIGDAGLSTNLPSRNQAPSLRIRLAPIGWAATCSRARCMA